MGFSHVGAVFGFYNFGEGGSVVMLTELTKTPDKLVDASGRFTVCFAQKYCLGHWRVLTKLMAMKKCLDVQN